MKDDNEYGLVFSGGGGKGAYEIGVWKALREEDIRITAVSGTSVGALNAVLFAKGDYEKAEYAWKKAHSGKMLKDPALKLGNIKDVSVGMILGQLALNIPMGFIPAISITFLRTSLVSLVKNRGAVFSSEGVRELIRDAEVLEHLGDKISCYASCLNISGVPKLEDFKLNNRKADEIESILLASAAIPIVFPNMKIGDSNYCDGGFLDPIFSGNTPVEPLIREGYKKIIVVCLSDDPRMRDKLRSKYEKDAVLTFIYPSSPINIVSTLVFDQGFVKDKIDCGYNDVKKYLNKSKVQFTRDYTG